MSLVTMYFVSGITDITSSRVQSRHHQDLNTEVLMTVLELLEAMARLAEDQQQYIDKTNLTF